MSTPSAVIWSIGDGDLGEAIRCGLTVRARARDGQGAVTKVADLGVDVSMQAAGDNAGDAPQLQAVTMTDGGGGEPPGEATAHFVVPPLDFARSVPRGPALSIGGAAFDTSLSIGGTGVTTETVEVEEAMDEGQEIEIE